VQERKLHGLYYWALVQYLGNVLGLILAGGLLVYSLDDSGQNFFTAEGDNYPDAGPYVISKLERYPVGKQPWYRDGQ